MMTGTAITIGLQRSAGEPAAHGEIIVGADA